MANNRLFINCHKCNPIEAMHDYTKFDEDCTVPVAVAFGSPWEVRNSNLAEDLQNFFEEHSWCDEIEFITEHTGKKKFSVC